MKMLKIPFTPAEDHTLTPALSLKERGKGGTVRGRFPLPWGEG